MFKKEELKPELREAYESEVKEQYNYYQNGEMNENDYHIIISDLQKTYTQLNKHHQQREVRPHVTKL